MRTYQENSPELQEGVSHETAPTPGWESQGCKEPHRAPASGCLRTFGRGPHLKAPGRRDQITYEDLETHWLQTRGNTLEGDWDAMQWNDRLHRAFPRSFLRTKINKEKEKEKHISPPPKLDTATSLHYRRWCGRGEGGGQRKQGEGAGRPWEAVGHNGSECHTLSEKWGGAWASLDMQKK